MSKEQVESFKSFIDWGFKICLIGLGIILWQTMGDVKRELSDDIKDVQTDIKVLIGEVSTLKGKVDTYHK
jgi:hypothetical protein